MSRTPISSEFFIDLRKLCFKFLNVLIFDFLGFMSVKNGIPNSVPDLWYLILFFRDDFDEGLKGLFDLIDICFEQFHRKGIIYIIVVHNILIIFHGVNPIADKEKYHKNASDSDLIYFFVFLSKELKKCYFLMRQSSTGNDLKFKFYWGGKLINVNCLGMKYCFIGFIIFSPRNLKLFANGRPIIILLF